MSTLPAVTRAVLATYPPSFKDRYGIEQRALLEDLGAKGTTANLVVGSIRAWLTPSFGERGPQWRGQRLLATASTIWVTWVAAFFGTMTWTRSVGDPPVPAMQTGWGWNIDQVANYAFTIGVISIALIVITLFVSVVSRARRNHTWHELKPLIPFGVMLAVVAGGAIAISQVRWSSLILTSPEYANYPQTFPTWFVVVLLAWVALLIPLIITSVVGPVRVLRKVGVRPELLRISVLLGAVPVLCLVVIASTTAAFVVGERLTHEDALIWQALAAVGLVIVAVVAVVSYARSLPAMRTDQHDAALATH
jgi:NADH:ubiquinone oxidoreductase subunit 6 (subunit J)